MRQSFGSFRVFLALTTNLLLVLSNESDLAESKLQLSVAWKSRILGFTNLAGSKFDLFKWLCGSLW